MLTAPTGHLLRLTDAEVSAPSAPGHPGPRGGRLLVAACPHEAKGIEEQLAEILTAGHRSTVGAALARFVRLLVAAGFVDI